eukprot:TRINITY_DN20296_c0_g1_i1.p1 TRINITY_DN20296_c0_g1~~TRINITY_DN20296_c0_g1_i1.p1  ORF type:complete len:1964 (+),score=691.25 TRINITY_DN20296_c0_g1_i1:49-5940(+)
MARVAMCLAALWAARAGAQQCVGEEGCIPPSVVLGGSLVEHNSELNVIKGGETIELTLTTDGPDGPMRFKEETVESDAVFAGFLSDFAHAAGDNDTFVAHLPGLLRREDAALTEDRRTLTLTLSPSPRFKVQGEERVFLHLPPLVLDCKCSYRIRVMSALTIAPAVAPRPLVHSPPVTCASTFALEARPLDDGLAAIVRDSVRVQWELLAVSGKDGAYIPEGSVWLTAPEALTTEVGGMTRPGNVTVKVSLIVLDSVHSSEVVVERIESPEPAEVAQPIMQVAGSQAWLSATPVPASTSSGARGEWSVGFGSPDIVFDGGNYSDPRPFVRNLTTPTKILWSITGHPKCAQTTAEIDLRTEHAAVRPHDAEVCSANAQTTVSAVPPTLGHIKGEWSVVSTPGDAPVHFVPHAGNASPTVVGFGHGLTVLRWTLYGDGESEDAVDVRFVRKLEPVAAITSRAPQAFLGDQRIEVTAERPDEGTGQWALRSSTCRKPIKFLNATDPNGVLLDVEFLTEPCRVELSWTVRNPPCAEAVDSIAFAIVPRPPTKPEVGAPIVLCEEGEVRLTGNKVQVGTGRWVPLDPLDLAIPDPSDPRTVLPSVRVGKTEVRWEIASGNDTEHADLRITRHALPKAVITHPADAAVQFCGGTIVVAADPHSFGRGDFGRWGVSDGHAKCVTHDSSQAEVCTAAMRPGDAAPPRDDCGAGPASDTDLCDPEECLASPKVTLTELPPGRSVVEWRTNNRASAEDCPAGNVAALTIDTYQFPMRAHKVYTLEEGLEVDLRELLFEACQGIDEDYTPVYLDSLADLNGVWSAVGDVAFADAESARTQVKHLPLGTTSLKWTPAVCADTAHAFRVDVVRGERLSCHIYRTDAGEAGGGHIHVVGDTAELSIGRMEFPLAAKGRWSAPDADGVEFSNPGQDATVVTGLPEGDTAVVFHISSGIPAFDGECEATVTSYRAVAPPSEHAVCTDTAEVRAGALPAHTPEGLTARWSALNPDVVIAAPEKPVTAVSGLSAGGNVLTWSVEYEGSTDSVDVVVERHTLPLPFGADGFVVEKRIVNMRSLSLPWEARAEWPQTPEEWTAPPGHAVRYEPGAVVLEGFAANAVAKFQFTIQPGAGSACMPALFTLEVRAITAEIVASTVATECELLAGATMVLEAGKGLEWKAAPTDADFAGLRLALGEVLDTAFVGAARVEGRPELLQIQFAPAVLPGDEPSVKPLTVRNVPIPAGLLAAHVVTQPDSLVLFRSAGGVVSTEFTVWPVEVALAVDGRMYTTEEAINEGLHEALELQFNHASAAIVDGFVADLPKKWIEGPAPGADANASATAAADGGAEPDRGGSRVLRTRLLDALTTELGEADPYGWDRRRRSVLQYSAAGTAGATLKVRMAGDLWYTIGRPDGFQLDAPLPVVCGLPRAADTYAAGLPRPPRAVVSNRIEIADTPGRLTLTGEVNECDFEKLGANLTVTAVGTTFAEAAALRPSNFKSTQPGFPLGWEAMVARGIFNATMLDQDHPKRRVLFIHPVGGAIYEIPQGEHEALSLRVPQDALVHPPANLTASGSITIHDTAVEVLGTVICADALRSVGHTFTIKLLGDAWVPGITSGRRAADLIGALESEGRGVRKGWETAMMEEVLPQQQYKLTLVTPSELQVTILPMKGYRNTDPESIGLRIPGVSTRCSKCLEHKAMIHIYHPHDLLADRDELVRNGPGDDTLTLTLPCGRYSPTVTPEDVVAGFRTAAPILNGFDAYQAAVLARPVEWVNNHTVAVPLHWPAGMNATHNETLTVELPETAVVPHTPGRPVRLVRPVLLRAVPHTAPRGWVLWTWDGVAAAAPAVLFWLMTDFLKLENVGRYVERQGALFRLPFTDFVCNGCAAAWVLAGCVLAGPMMSPLARDHWSLRAAWGAYRMLGAAGGALFWLLLVATDFQKLARFGTGQYAQAFALQRDLCFFFSAVSVAAVLGDALLGV